jgi:hypothetical protein
VPGDYDGDGECDPALYDPGKGNIRFLSSRDGLAHPSSSLVTPESNWRPAPADYDGDGKMDVAWYAPRKHGGGRWRIWLSTTGSELVPNLVFGGADDIPVPGDYNGDGFADLALWNGASSRYKVSESSGGGSIGHYLSSWESRQPAYAHPGWIPAPGDYNGDGRTDCGWLQTYGKGRMVIEYSDADNSIRTDNKVVTRPLPFGCGRSDWPVTAPILLR